MDINSIEELNEHVDDFGGRIVGIDGGAGIMLATEQAIEDYGLGLELLESSDMAMTAALVDAYMEEEWIVVTGWTPHWKFARYDLKFLEDPRGIYGGAEDSIVARQGLDILEIITWKITSSVQLSGRLELSRCRRHAIGLRKTKK